MCAKDNETHETVLLDCTTGQAGSGPAKPGEQSSHTSRVRFTVISHTPVRSRFYDIHILYKRNWDGSWLMNLPQKVTHSYISFEFAICSFALLSLGETCHLKGRDLVTVWRTVPLLSCYDCDSTRQHYDVTRFEYVLWRRTMHESPKGDSWTWAAPPRNQGACVIIAWNPWSYSKGYA